MLKICVLIPQKGGSDSYRGPFLVNLTVILELTENPHSQLWTNAGANALHQASYPLQCIVKICEIITNYDSYLDFVLRAFRALRPCNPRKGNMIQANIITRAISHTTAQTNTITWVNAIIQVNTIPQ